jgi:hypothetical protein
MSELLPLAEELSQVYARMSGLLLSEETVQTALDLVTSLALDTIGGAVGAGVTLIDADGNRESAAATSPLVARADALQYDLDEGPCLTAWADNVQVRIDDLQTDEPWPAWRRAALPGCSVPSRCTGSGPVPSATEVPCWRPGSPPRRPSCWPTSRPSTGPSG